MPRFMRRVSKKIGLPPGALVHIGEKKAEKVRLTLLDYDEKHCQDKELERIEECFPLKDEPTVTWINVDGIHEVEVIEKIGKNFNIHTLTLEDILNTAQRPKVEDFEHYVFIVLKMLYYDPEENRIKAEQVSLILGSTYIISFQEREGDVFNSVRERISKGKGRIRKAGVDYLAYASVDAIVDH